MFRVAIALMACLILVTVLPATADECPAPASLCHRAYLPHVRRDATPTQTATPTATPIPTIPPWPTSGDLVVEQATLLVDSQGDKKVVGRYRNNVKRWVHNFDNNIDIDLLDATGSALGTALGLVSSKASGWGIASCFDALLDENEQTTESFRIRTSVDDFFGDVGPRTHLETFDVRIVPVHEGSYKVVGQVRNQHDFPVRGTGMMAITVLDAAGTVVECADVSTDDLQPGQTQVFETFWLHEKVGRPAAVVETQCFVQPLGQISLWSMPASARVVAGRP